MGQIKDQELSNLTNLYMVSETKIWHDLSEMFVDFVATIIRCFPKPSVNIWWPKSPRHDAEEC